MAEEQALLGSGEAHVTEAAFLFQGGGILQGAVAGEQSLLQTHQEDHRKLQSLAGMEGHQGDPVGGGVLAVGITGQGGAGQEALQGALLVFLLVLQSGIDQLLEVAAAFLGFVAGLGNQLGNVTALLHHPLHQLGGG